MTTIRRDKERIKETISVKEGKTRLRQHNNYGWTLVNELHTLENKTKCNEWSCFVKKIKQLPENV
jgi:hypothetical protein